MKTKKDYVSKVKADSYVHIQAFMVNELHLKDKELLLYALIYGFTQDGESWFNGSLQYMADWLQIDRKHVYARYLKPLIDKGLIIRKEEKKNEITFPIYQAIKPCLEQNGSTVPKTDVTRSQNTTNQNKVGANNLDNTIVNNLDNDVVVKNIKYSMFDMKRFLESEDVKTMILRINEATRSNELTDKAVNYLSSKCNSFGSDNIKIINTFTDNEYSEIFKLAIGLVDSDDGTFNNVVNRDGLLMNTIKKCINNHLYN